VAAAFGEDVYGDFCWETLANQEMVDLSASRRIPNWHSPFTVSLAYRGDRSMVTHEHPSPIPLQDMARDLPQARAAFVSLSNEDGVPEWAQEQAKNGTLIFADVGWDDSQRWSPSVLEQLRHCHAFMPNAIEAMAYTRTGSPALAVAALAEHVPVAVVTDGPRGAIAIDQTTGEEAEVEGIVIDAVDTTGAGDVFGAGFIMGTLAGWPLEQRLRFANLCAALSVPAHRGGRCRLRGGRILPRGGGRCARPAVTRAGSGLPANMVFSGILSRCRGCPPRSAGLAPRSGFARDRWGSLAAVGCHWGIVTQARVSPAVPARHGNGLGAFRVDHHRVGFAVAGLPRH